MKLKEIISESVYGTIGYIGSIDDISTLESYIIYNLPIIKEYKQVIVATNYKNYPELVEENTKLWKKYFPDCVLINSEINRGHSFGTADLDDLVFDYCKENNIKWLCKVSNDVILQETILDIDINEADFYYFNGTSYTDIVVSNFDYDKLYSERFYPQTNFFLIDVSKCDYLNDKNYVNETYDYVHSIPSYKGRPWEYVKDWSCELFARYCVERNNLIKYHLLTRKKHDKLCKIIELYKIGDPSHKNIMIEGVCHFQYPNQEIIML